jgi:hypothetical protein
MNKTETVEHYKKGVGEFCLVCDEKLYGGWTDYNGQIRCEVCGTTYQINGSHLSDKFLEENKLSKDDIAKKYCDIPALVPLLRDYWQEKKRKVPFGTYLGNSPIPKDDYDTFYGWLKENADKYRKNYEEDFYWERILDDAED